MKPFAVSSVGFTLLELTLAVSVMVTLGGMAIRGLSTSLRDAAVDAGARTIEQASGIARQLAVNPAGRAQIETSRRRDDWRYGVVIIDARDDGTPAEVAVTYGPDASSACILRDGDGVAVFRQQLNRNVALYTCSSGGGPLRPASGSVGWMYQYDTGLTAAAAVATLRAACIGTAADRLVTAGYAAEDIDVIAERAALGTRDARLRLAIEVAPSGLLATLPWSL